MAGFSILTVTQLNSYVKMSLESDERLKGMYLRGEISNCSVHRTSGHIYFTLKDNESAVKAVMFKGSARGLKFTPENGMTVIIYGDASLYTRDGAYQIYVYDMHPDGVGEVYLALEQLKRKLAQEGIFDTDKKKNIPRMPDTIGIITARGSAALQDMLNTLRRRYPCCEVLVADVTVQGAEAAERVVRAIKYIDGNNLCDEIIIARGGGSAEDLWQFNDERVVRAVYECNTPVISAIGHETDYTLLDLAADLRAPTPTAAAELAAVDIRELKEVVGAFGELLENRAKSVFAQKKMEYKAVSGGIDIANAYKIIERNRQSNKNLISLIEKSAKRTIEDKKKSFCSAVKVLESASPLKTLMRGYSAVKKDDVGVSSVEELFAGDEIKIMMYDGRVSAEVKAVEKIERTETV